MRYVYSQHAELDIHHLTRNECKIAVKRRERSPATVNDVNEVLVHRVTHNKTVSEATNETDMIAYLIIVAAIKT